MIVDAKERLEAINPAGSYIVQAPAGSGKTELLVQRFLSLLSKVNSPEEIVAVTFTKKAAAGMKFRILTALQESKGDKPIHDYALKTWELARQALEIDAKNSWNILDNASRLKIITIDSLCGKVTKLAPFSSNFGGSALINDDIKSSYKQAAQDTLASLEEGKPWSDALAKLLFHLDNRVDRLEDLFVQMLTTREQWMPYILCMKDSDSAKENLEEALAHIVNINLNKFSDAIKSVPGLLHSLNDLLCFAASNFSMDDEINQFDFNLICNKDAKDFNFSQEFELQYYQFLANYLSTSSNEVRKTVTVKQGFLAASKGEGLREKELFKEKKHDMLDVLSIIRDIPDIKEMISNVKLLPKAEYTNHQWGLIDVLLQVLPILIAHLKLIFQSTSKVDFNEISQAAVLALGGDENPTDLALLLDHSIKHILIDEFQDTSVLQYKLFSKLLAGWQEGDGRSIFLVGDPMQSIYRFRGAEVSLFLRTIKYGIADVPLKLLRLRTNFRASSNLIDWFNKSFSKVLPSKDDILFSKVSYFSAVAVKEAENSKISYHKTLDKRLEAEKTVEIVKSELSFENRTVAILVRSRKHLLEILSALKNEDISYIAHELESLVNNKLILQLMSLLRAYISLEDRIAWLAILRAPWCGIEIVDLTKLSDGNIYSNLLNYEKLDLSNNAKDRLKVFVPIIQYFLAMRKRKPLASQIRSLWYAFNGPAFTNNLDDAEKFFILLDTVSKGEDVLDLEYLDEKLISLYAEAKAKEGCKLHVMTIHKSKGLEYDSVILPGLNNKTVNDEDKLLLFKEIASDNTVDFVLAPIHEANTKEDKIYNFLKSIEKQKNSSEAARLLYVAATRAKQNLHLIAAVDESNGKELVIKGSFLDMLEGTLPYSNPSDKEEITNIEDSNNIVDGNVITPISENIDIKFSRVRSLSLPSYIPNLQNIRKYNPYNEQNEIEIDFSYEPKKNVWQYIGIIAHRLLQESVEKKLKSFAELDFTRRNSSFKRLFLSYGVDKELLDFAVNTLKTAVSNTFDDNIGKWILKDRLESYCEFPLTVHNQYKNKYENLILDRCFFEDDVFWIVDYKITEHDLLEDELVNYKPQLNNYARVVKKIWPARKVKLGLYFPLQKLWYSWE